MINDSDFDDQGFSPDSQASSDATVDIESDQLLVDAAGAIEGSTLDDPDHLVEELDDAE